MFTASTNRLTRTLVSSLVIWRPPFYLPTLSGRVIARGVVHASCLPHQAKSVFLAALLHYPAADQAVDGDPSPTQWPARLRNTQQFAAMRATHAPARNDFVRFGDLLLN